MEQKELQDAVQNVASEFRSNLENSIREMVKNLPAGAARNIQAGLDGAAGLGEDFMKNLGSSIQGIINSSLEMAKQAIENNAASANVQGLSQNVTSKHTVINGETVE